MRWRLWVLGLSLVLSACSSQPPLSNEPIHKPSQGGATPYARPSRDGAPWWDVDVSKIPDATPTPHYGAVKANPYTVMGKAYYPIPDARNYNVTGTASWYGTKFHGQATANGENYDLYGMSAAHKTLPLPCYVRVTNLENGRSVIVRVNDRGPFYSDRIIDLSFAAAKKLGYAETGTARVRVEGIDPAQWLAQQGRAVPVSQVSASPPVIMSAPLETYTPPPAQHAAAVTPGEIPYSATSNTIARGLYLQVAALANPDAAELLKARLNAVVGNAPVFVSPIVRGQQVLHRVRLGPLDSPAEARRIQDTVRLASLGQPTVVSAE
ncbi:MAG: septal ring lytic transglycosylase RlpA family protein [Pseudomonas sp.]